MNFSSAPSSNPSPAPDSFNSQLHENNSAPDKAILDLNSPHFDAEYYVQDLLKRKGLEELVAVEQDMVSNVRRLDSEMQSLVYENYSKFLNATSTVKNMQNRLADTHKEMRDLSSQMKHVTNLSGLITEKFSKNCEKVKKLNEAKDSIKKLEFLVKAPLVLQNCIDHNQFEKAVDFYIVIKPKLEKFQDIPSIAGIASDSEKIMRGMKGQLRETLNGRLISSEDVIEAVKLLRRLGVPEQELEGHLLKSWQREIQAELDQLEASANPEKDRFLDIFNFVDAGCCHFLTNLSLMSTTFLHLFHKQDSKGEFIQLLEMAMQRFEKIVDRRFMLEQNASECALFVKALDRIYRKISVLTRISPGFNFTRLNTELVLRLARHQISVCRQHILTSTQTTIEEAFVQLNKSPPNQPSSKSDSGRTALPYSSSTGIRHDRKEFLRRILEKIENGFIHAVKGSLAALLMFTASDIIFSSISHFPPLFGFDVHQQIVVATVQELAAEIQSRSDRMGKANSPRNENEESGIELLILCIFLRNLQIKHLDYLLELCQEQYRLSEFNFAEKLTTGGELVQQLKNVVGMVLRRFVEIQSGIFIQMTRKNIDNFDWANCAESPKRVRSLVKHLVHSLEEMDKDLAVFMDDGLAKLKERTPDSLHGFTTMRRATSAASSVYNDASSISSGGIVERLWGEGDNQEESGTETEGIESAATIQLEFRRDMVTNAVVRLTLRAMCDFLRAHKFSRQGLEQLQVDCAFIRQRLWACVGDEHMLNVSLEDVLTAAVNQCAQPKLLDPSVVRSICEET